MKKLTAMLLSLMMCFSLMAIPTQATPVPDPDSPGIIDIDIGDTPLTPGDDVPDAPAQAPKLPEPVGEMPVD